MAEFPRRTEGPHQLPDGTTVWVKTLNSTFRARAEDAGTLAGRIASAPARKGGSAYSALSNSYKALSPEDQAEFVARCYQDMGSYDNKAEELFPDPVKPDRKQGEDEKAYLDRLDAYDKEKEEVLLKREKKCKELYESKKNEVVSMSAKDRLESCLTCAVLQRYYNGFSEGYNARVIYYAVRQSEDHNEFYFGDDIQAALRKIDDLDDDVRESILVKYNELSVAGREIPT